MRIEYAKEPYNIYFQFLFLIVNPNYLFIFDVLDNFLKIVIIKSISVEKEQSIRNFGSNLFILKQPDEILISKARKRKVK